MAVRSTSVAAPEETVDQRADPEAERDRSTPEVDIDTIEQRSTWSKLHRFSMSGA
jgi:hypothetical protein